ncbi:MAG: hypothetical protein ACRDK5_09750 [Solirubrobacterales bacterium]
MRAAIRTKVLLVIGSAVAVAAIAGCGGSDEVSAEELVQQGDDVCREVQERFTEIQAQPPANASEGAEQAGELLGVADDAQAELRDLEPPAELRDGYDGYLDARDELSDALERGKQAAEDQDGDAYGKAQEEAASGAPERQRLARELGFRVCSQSAEAP